MVAFVAAMFGLAIGFGVLYLLVTLGTLSDESWLESLQTGVALEGSDPASEPFVVAGEFLVVGFIFWSGAIVGNLVQGRPVRALVVPARPFRWVIVGKVLAASVLLAVVLTSLQLLVVPGDTEVDFTGLGVEQLAWLIPMSLIVLIQTSGEDVFFKGWLLHRLGAVTRVVWLAPLTVTVIFVALHLGNADFDSDLVVLLPLFLLSEFMIMYLIIRTGGMEAALVLHWVNNIAIVFFLAERTTQANDLTLLVSETPGAQNALVDEEIVGAASIAISYLLMLVAFVWKRSPFHLEQYHPPREVALSENV